jgi:hypothetical protein
LSYYDNFGTLQHVGEQLLIAGYDLVMLDLSDGGGYIERNAKVAIETINFLNRSLQENGSQEQLVIVGPSMGGMITRYALAYMEQNPGPNTNNGNHNTRLWISFDAPHQGANISLGAQEFMHFFGFIGGVQQAKNTYNDVINCVAARQMLERHHNNTAGSVFNTFYTNLNSLGYPTNLRKIAISNGCLNGTRNGNGCSLTVDLYTVLNINATKIRLYPDNGSCEVFFGRCAGNLSAIYTSRRVNYSAVPGKCGIDGAPGSQFNTFKEIGMAAYSNNQIKKVTINRGYHTFMTTLSVLDVSEITDYCAPIPNNPNDNIVTRGMTPFDAYWGPIGKNMDHVSFDQNLVDWLFNEIGGITYRISGTTSICGTETFTLTNPHNDLVEWRLSPNFGFTITNPNATSVTITACPNLQTTLTAMISGIPIAIRNIQSCTAVSARINGPITLGGDKKPYNIVLVDMPSELYTDHTRWNSTGNVTVDRAYGLSVLANATSHSKPDTGTILAFIPTTEGCPNIVFRHSIITTTDPPSPPPSRCRCGNLLPCSCVCCNGSGGIGNDETILGGTMFEYLVEKNPTDFKLDIIFIRKPTDDDDENPSTDNPEINISVRLHDNTGFIHSQTRHKRRRRDGESSVRFDVSNLREGTYFLHIESDGQIIKEQIIITR